MSTKKSERQSRTLASSDSAEAERDALVMQVASWCMRYGAANYKPMRQLAEEFSKDVVVAAGG